MHSGATAGLAVLVAVGYLSWHCPVPCQAAELPKSFTLCSRNQPELNKCVGPAIKKAIEAMKDGIPSLRVLPIDPLLVNSIKAELGAERSLNFKLDMTNCSLAGLADMEIQSASMDTKEQRYDLQVLLPKMEITGDYEIDGKFLLLPLRGKGKFKMSLTSTEANLTVFYDEETKNGDVYWHMKPFNLLLLNTKLFTVNFENLFNGDKVLGESTNKAMNDNWNVLWNEMRPVFQDTFGQVFTEIGNMVYSQVPIENIFLD